MSQGLIAEVKEALQPLRLSAYDGPMALEHPNALAHVRTHIGPSTRNHS
jgi:hypothetical protein